MMSIDSYALEKAYNLYRHIYPYLPDRFVINLDYYHVFRRFPDISRPKRYTEKIQWYKIHGKLESFYEYVDKFLVREYVKNKIGDKYLVPLVGIWDEIDEIEWEIFPKTFVLKLTHGSGYNIICKDKELFDYDLAKTKIKFWKSENYYKIWREPQYKKCLPRIIVEKYLGDGYLPLLDYKVFCFKGVPHFIQVDFDRETNHKRVFYDTEWNRLPFTTFYPQSEKNAERPDNLNEMLGVASRLSDDFRHVRVDLYNPGGQLYFGELTFTHGNGLEPFYPDEWDFIVGQSLSLD